MKRMNLIMKCRFLALLLVISFLGSIHAAQAQTQIATVDLKKVFDGYFKTVQADVLLKERGQQAEEIMKGMMQDYEEATEEYKRLLESANDQAISAVERERRKTAAENKLVEIKEIERSVRQYRTTTQDSLEEQQRRMRDEILTEIRQVISTKARAANYPLVIDIASQTINQTPVVLFSDGKNDITDEVLAEINAKAPPGVLEKRRTP